MKKPVAKDFYLDSGFHSAMQAWARSKDKTSASVIVEFIDGSGCGETFHTFDRKQREFEYKALDSETYTVLVDTAKFDPCFLDKYDIYPDGVTLSQLKKLFIDWLAPEEYKNITWNFED